MFDVVGVSVSVCFGGRFVGGLGAAAGGGGGF